MWPMLSKTLMVRPMLHFPIFVTDCDQGTVQFDAFFVNQRNLSSFHSDLQPFITWGTFKKLQSWTTRFDPYRPFKTKNDQTGFELHYTSQNVYQRLYVSNHIVASNILYKFPQKALFFSPFLSKAIFFLYLHHFK